VVTFTNSSGSAPSVSNFLIHNHDSKDNKLIIDEIRIGTGATPAEAGVLPLSGSGTGGDSLPPELVVDTVNLRIDAGSATQVSVDGSPATQNGGLWEASVDASSSGSVLIEATDGTGTSQRQVEIQR